MIRIIPRHGARLDLTQELAEPTFEEKGQHFTSNLLRFSAVAIKAMNRKLTEKPDIVTTAQLLSVNDAQAAFRTLANLMNHYAAVDLDEQQRVSVRKIRDRIGRRRSRDKKNGCSLVAFPMK